ncbi:spore coat protein [Priestia aryabhattai B8W22]|nr:spore coat protein [Priestia aryabhattai B8W22]
MEGSSHPAFNAVRENQVAKQKEETVQYSEETIFVCDSADVEVNTTSIKAALSVQAALQAAIVLVLTIAIGSSAEAESIAQELFQKSSIKQINRQRTVIKNSRNVKVTVSDTEIAINIQVLIELLLALLVELEIQL